MQYHSKDLPQIFWQYYIGIQISSFYFPNTFSRKLVKPSQSIPQLFYRINTGLHIYFDILSPFYGNVLDPQFFLWALRKKLDTSQPYRGEEEYACFIAGFITSFQTPNPKFHLHNFIKIILNPCDQLQRLTLFLF